jgi:glycosyltransferase involved in cell wall biosynthesis
MRPLRIALVHPFSWPEVHRGGERYLHDLAWYLTGAGHEVHIITGTEGEPSVTITDGVTIHRYRHWTRAPGLGRPLSALETFGIVALAALARNRFDLAHALTPTGAIGARLTGHRVMYTLLGHPTRQDFTERGDFSRQLFTLAVRSATAATALSKAAARQGSAISRGRVHALYPGVRLDQFTPDLRPRSGAPIVLFPADASEVRKGLDFTLAAVTRLLERRPDLRLQLGGPGNPSWVTDAPAHDVTPSVARALAATDCLGVADLGGMPSRYRAASVTILPSVNEAFGLVLAESLACGTPVVGSAGGGIPEIISRPTVGRTAPYGDTAALAKALEEAIELSRDPATPSRCVEAATRWGWQEVVGPAHERFYEAVMSDRRHRAARLVGAARL